MYTFTFIDRILEMSWQIYLERTYNLFRKKYSKKMWRVMYVHFIELTFIHKQ